MKVKLENSNQLFEIDDEDFERVTLHKWYITGKGKGIIISWIKGRTVCLTYFLTSLLNIDHKDRNPFNNKKNNFRAATTQQNNCNREKYKNNTSGFKGVTWSKRNCKWKAQIKFKNKLLFLGYFTDKILAAIAYDDAAIELQGEFSCLNFPLYGA